MKILLDTNFIISCINNKIDFITVAESLTDNKVEWLVPQQVLNELGNLKDRKGMKTKDKAAAELSFELLQSTNPEIIDLGKGREIRNVDIAIVNYILGKDITLATLDRNLKKRINNKILTIRGKNNLEII